MDEKKLTAALSKRLRAVDGAVVIRHSETFLVGIPDLSFTWNGKTTWLEVKYANPGLKDRKAQHLMLLRLAEAGEAWYVVYTGDRTYVVAPRRLGLKETDFAAASDGHDHDLVAEFLVRRHTAAGAARRDDVGAH